MRGHPHGVEQPTYRVDRVDGADGLTSLHFSGELHFRECFASWQEVRRLTEGVHPPRRVALDLSGVEHLDGAATALLLELRSDLDRVGLGSEIVGAQGGVQ